MEDQIEALNFDEEENTKKVIELKPNEKAKIKQTIEEMKQNQVQPQLSVGRKFVGPGFVSKPATIVYKDFEIGEKMSLTIDIINISYSFNSFHLQPLDDDIIDFFEIDYRPCGRIPAGISTKMTLHFTPLVNKDYKSSLKLLSETGQCEIPILCYCKKCLIDFDSNVIDYGEVILGQEIQKQMALTNSGALSCQLAMNDVFKEPLANKDDEDEEKEELELEQSYKDYIDCKVITHKLDFLTKQASFGEKALEVIKERKVALKKEELIQKYKDEQAEKEREEAQQLTAANNSAAANKKPDPKKKPNEKAKAVEAPKVEVINGVPVDVMSEIEEKAAQCGKDYTVQDPKDKSDLDEVISQYQKENNRYYMLKQLTFPLKSQIKGYSKKGITFILNSKYIGEYSIKALLKIEYKGQIEYKEFSVLFKVVDLPIHSEKKTYELNYIIYDQIFREKIVLVNSSPVPYKLQVYHHKNLNDYIELNPNLGYIQANSSFDIWLKLKVTKSVSQLINFFKGKEENEYNFPLRIVLNNIAIPLITSIHFHITSDKIKLSSKMLNYDKCPIDEATKMCLSLENMSALPMRYGFIMLPKEFTVKINIDHLLSAAKTSVDVIYDSKDGYLGHREGDIFCRVVTDELTCQNLKLKYHIELVSADLEIKPKKICFQALPEGESEEIRLMVTNKTDKCFQCEYLSPPKCISGLTIMPKVFEIEPKKYTAIVMRFDSEFRDYGPFSAEEVEKELGISLADGLEQEEKEIEMEGNTNELLEEKVKKEVDAALTNTQDQGDKKKKGNAPPQQQAKKEVKKLDPKKDKKALEEEEKKKKEEEDRKLKEEEDKKNQRIQAFNKENELRYFGAKSVFKDTQNDRSSHWEFIIPLFYRLKLAAGEEEDPRKGSRKTKASFIEVHTTCVEKLLVFDKTEINFGEVSIETRKTINVVLTNKSNKTAVLKMKPLILTNSFSIVNAIRDIPPNSSFNYIVEFFPLKDLPYFDEFTVYTADMQSTVKLKGFGVKPEVETSIPDGLLFLGNTVVQNTIEKTFDITSKSNFPITFEIKTVKFGKKNKTGLRPFCYIPYCGEIGPNGKVQIRVSFTGDHQDFENFFDFILIDVPNQKKENRILVSAQCWNRQAYWKEHSVLSFPDDAFLLRNIEQDFFVDCLKLKSNSPSSNNDKINLVFQAEHMVADKNNQAENEKCFKRKIIIGNSRLNDVKSEKNVAYEILMSKDDQYFTCDNPKGSVNGGSELVISFTYKKPQPDPLLKDIDCLSNIGMWVNSKVELKLSGGFIQPNATDAVSIEINLKAYVEQI